MTFKDTIKNSNISFSGVVINTPSTGTYNVAGTTLPSWASLNSIVVCYINNGTTAYTGYISAQPTGTTLTITFDTNPTIPLGSTLSVYSYVRKSFTIAYNDFIDAYTSFYSFTPSVYLNDQMAIFSPESGLNTIYRHDIGTHGYFYGNGPYKSTIKLIVNPYPTETKVFDNYEMVTEVIDLNLGFDVANKTFDRIRLYNDFQNTDFQELPTDLLTSKDTAKRKERTWNISNLRNRVLYNGGATTNIFDTGELSTYTLATPQLNLGDKVFGERMRDKYLIVDLEYDNLTDKRLIFHTFKTNYRKSAR